MPRSEQVVGILGRCLLAFSVLLVGTEIQAEDREQWQQPDRVMADLHLQPGMRVADVGCGTGFFTFRLAKAVGPKGKVLALDVSPDALKPVRELVARESLRCVEVIQSEPRKTGIRPLSLDAALVCLVLHEASPDDRLPLVRDVARALKPDGFLFVIDHRKSHEVKFDPYEKLIPREDLVKFGTDAGLVLDAEFHYLKYQVFLRFHKPPATKPEQAREE